VTAAVVAFVPTTLQYMRNPKYRSLGASGAVAAVMFSAVLLYPGMSVGIVFLPFTVPAWLYGLLYLAYTAWQSYRGRDGVNHTAHFAGAIYGALLTYVMEPQRVTTTLHRLLS
jgi:membrane associated rhomboid family serine protease